MSPAPDRSRPLAAALLGGLLLVVGVAAFLVPLHHGGSYSVPGRGVVSGLLSFALAGVLWAPTTPRVLRIAAFVVAPFVLFFTLFATLAEVEEVIVLHTDETQLRLWVVDAEGGEWVSMSRSKAVDNALDGGRFERTRRGETRCVIPKIVDDPLINRRTFDLRQEKYAVQRLAGKIGYFGDGPGPTTITLRLDPCDGP